MIAVQTAKRRLDMEIWAYLMGAALTENEITLNSLAKKASQQMNSHLLKL